MQFQPNSNLELGYLEHPAISNCQFSLGPGIVHLNQRCGYVRWFLGRLNLIIYISYLGFKRTRYCGRSNCERTQSSKSWLFLSNWEMWSAPSLAVQQLSLKWCFSKYFPASESPPLTPSSIQPSPTSYQPSSTTLPVNRGETIMQYRNVCSQTAERSL